MKKVEAYIRPEKLDDIKAILETHCLNGISVMQVMGCGNQKGWTEYIRGSEVDYNFLPKIKLEIVMLDDQVEKVIQTILGELYTGEFGDGKIFVYNVEEAVRVRTGERGEAAIQ